MPLGFVVLYLYTHGYEPSDIYPALTALLVIVGSAEILRFSSSWFNSIYISLLGPMMRKTEISSRVNGVVYYLLGKCRDVCNCQGSMTLFGGIFKVSALTYFLLQVASLCFTAFQKILVRFPSYICHGQIPRQAYADVCLVNILPSIATSLWPGHWVQRP